MRESGFYWVMFEGTWEVFYWNGESWNPTRTITNMQFDSGNFTRISENLFRKPKD